MFLMTWGWEMNKFALIGGLVVGTTTGMGFVIVIVNTLMEMF